MPRGDRAPGCPRVSGGETEPASGVGASLGPHLDRNLVAASRAGGSGLRRVQTGRACSPRAGAGRRGRGGRGGRRGGAARARRARRVGRAGRAGRALRPGGGPEAVSPASRPGRVDRHLLPGMGPLPSRAERADAGLALASPGHAACATSGPPRASVYPWVRVKEDESEPWWPGPRPVRDPRSFLFPASPRPALGRGPRLWSSKGSGQSWAPRGAGVQGRPAGATC